MQAVMVREFGEHDRAAVIELWRGCGLIRSWNDPNLDIDRKLAVDDAMFFVAALGSDVVGSVMAGYDGHRLQRIALLVIGTTVSGHQRENLQLPIGSEFGLFLDVLDNQQVCKLFTKELQPLVCVHPGAKVQADR